MSPIRLCSEASCANPATARGRCDEHRKTLERERSRDRRAESYKRFYDTKRWAMTRRRVLLEKPLCENCGRIAEHVHHDPPLARLLATGADPFDPNVLHPLCKPCHSAATLRELRGKGGR